MKNNDLLSRLVTEAEAEGRVSSRRMIIAPNERITPHAVELFRRWIGERLTYVVVDCLEITFDTNCSSPYAEFVIRDAGGDMTFNIYRSQNQPETMILAYSEHPSCLDSEREFEQEEFEAGKNEFLRRLARIVGKLRGIHTERRSRISTAKTEIFAEIAARRLREERKARRKAKR